MGWPSVVLAATLTSSSVHLEYDGDQLAHPKASHPDDPCRVAIVQDADFSCWSRGDCPPELVETTVAALCYRREMLKARADVRAARTLAAAPDAPVLSESSGVPWPWIAVGALSILMAAGAGFAIGQAVH